MIRFLQSAAVAIAVFLGATTLATTLAMAQASVQQSPTRLDAAQGVCAIAAAVNATQAAGTCTITPPAGQYVYFTTIQVAACSDGTASTSSVQQNFTTTNMGGLVAETSFITGSTITTNAGDARCDRVAIIKGTPLKSAAPGTAVTIVPPAQAAHYSFPIIAEYYFAP